MRRLLIAAALAALVTAGAGGGTLTPAGAASSGTIEGVVTNAVTGDLQKGAEVTLLGSAQGEEDLLTRTATTGADGAFSFADLPAGDDRVYVLDVVHDRGLYSSGALTLPADTTEPPVVETTVKVWDTTADPRSIMLQRVDLFITPADDGTLDVIESVVAVNTSGLAYAGRGSDDGNAGAGSGTGERTPTLGSALPRGAAEGGVEVIDSNLEIAELVPTDFGFAITAAIPPGETRITFRYRVPGSAGSYDLSRTAVYPVISFSLHTPDGYEVDSNRLQSNGTVAVGGINYDRYSTSAAVEGGDAVQMSVLATGGTGGTPALLIGAVVAALFAVTAGVVVFSRRRREPALAREDLVAAIAQLDREHETGALSDREWSERRKDLKERLAATRR